MQDLTLADQVMQDLTMEDQVAGVNIARPDIMSGVSEGSYMQDPLDCKIWLFFSPTDSHAQYSLCNNGIGA